MIFRRSERNSALPSPRTSFQRFSTEENIISVVRIQSQPRSVKLMSFPHWSAVVGICVYLVLSSANVSLEILIRT